MTTENKLLEKLLERQQKLDQEIKEVKAAQAKKEQDIYKNKYRIVGAAILAELETNEELKAILNPIIDKNTIIAKDRKALSLEPLPKAKKETKIEE